MNDYIYYKIKRSILNYYDKFLNRPYNFKIGAKEVLDIEESNKFIKKKIESNKPFLICRIGTSEMQILNNYFDILYLYKHNFDDVKINVLKNNAGFFGNEIDVYKFVNLYLMNLNNIDGLALLTRQEEYIVKKYIKNAELLTLRGIEPYYAINMPWSSALEGKRVLVIHPFSDTIKKQYEKHNFLFADNRILPNFDIKVLKSVQTIAGEKDNRFSTWFEALNYMIEQAMKIDFDVALIGCGAYGFPLGAELKQRGKQVIHMGGATQILFGIKGNRWDNHPYISKFYNDYWVRPDVKECIQKKEQVENGCYW